MLLGDKFHFLKSIPPSNVVVETTQKTTQVTLDLANIYPQCSFLKANDDPVFGKITNNTA